MRIFSGSSSYSLTKRICEILQKEEIGKEIKPGKLKIDKLEPDLSFSLSNQKGFYTMKFNKII